MIRKIIIFLFALLMPCLGHAEVTATPTIDFGRIAYLPNGTGYSTVAISDKGQVTMSGTGNIQSQTGGAAGSITIRETGFLYITVYFYTDKTIVSDPISGTCGSVRIKNVTTTDGKTSDTDSGISFTSREASFPVGGDIEIVSVTGATECTITGTINNILSYGSRKTATPLKISVTLVPQAALSHDNRDSLNFGTLCASDNVQTLTVTPNGSISSSNLRCPATSDVSPDTFSVTAPVGTSYSVSLPNSIQLSNGSSTLTVTALTPSCNSCTTTSENDSFTIGGTITVPSNPEVGNYTGTYEVNITAN